MNRRLLPQKRRWGLLAAFLLVAAGLVTACFRWPELRQWAASTVKHVKPAHAESDGHDHADHEHGDADHDEDEHEHAHGGKGHYDHKHDEATAIKLSKQAQGNIGLHLARIELRPFERTITVPGMVVERPGWSVMEVTAPMTGVVTRIYPIQGEAVQPGQPLFEVRLTHEDLLQVQTEFLRTIEELDVIGREVARLEKVSADGVIAGKTLLERKYEQQKQEAALRAQRQALLLHGLSPGASGQDRCHPHAAAKPDDPCPGTGRACLVGRSRAPLAGPAVESRPRKARQRRRHALHAGGPP